MSQLRHLAFAGLIIVLSAPLFAQPVGDTVRAEGGASSIHLPSSFQWGSNTRVTMDGSIPPQTTSIRGIPFAILGAVYVTATAGVALYEANAWWSKDRGPFHIEEDWPENLQNDKFGHFYGTYMDAYLTREALLTSGFSDEAANNLGALMGTLYQLFVETQDGFSTQWGFSPTDAYFDILGGGYLVAQYYVPVLRNFHEKWSYWPSKFLGSGSIPGQQRTVFDDYQGQSFWWTVDMHNLLSGKEPSTWPGWLQLSLGYTARKYGAYLAGTPYCTGNPNDPACTDLPDTREVYIGIDYNLCQLIGKTGVPFLDWFIQSLDNIHFPAPALRLTPNVKLFLLYPISLNIGSLSF
jgi:hypothetical protein